MQKIRIMSSTALGAIRTLCYIVSMSFFCFLWMPLFYLFRRSFSGDNAAGGVWALLAGSIVALLGFFFGALVDPGGFGLSRWLSGFVDIVALPALAPLLVYLVMVCLRMVSGTMDFTNFAMLWLIPCGAIRALSWGAQNDPILLVLVPLLWTCIAVGIPFFINIIMNSRASFIIPALLAILIIPFAATSSYWAFFCQKNALGFLLLFAAACPMLASLIFSFVQARGSA